MLRFMRVPVAALVLSLAASTRAAAQDVIKPTSTTTTSTRLAAPTGLAARQLADGRILFTWHPVVGAASYTVWRSVPPAGITLVSEEQADTLYRDQDVRAGSTYYYMVAAVSAGGGLGLKASPPPVTATLSSTGTTSTTTGTTGGTTAAPLEAPPALGRFFAHEFGFPTWPYIQLYWRTSPGAHSYLVERLVGAPTDKSSWAARTRVDGVQCCAWVVTDRLDDVAPNTSVTYRVTAIDPANPANRSTPTVSDRIVTPNPPLTSASAFDPARTVVLPPPQGRVLQVAVGAQASLGAGRVVSMNESIVTVDAQGAVTGRSRGSAWVVLLYTRADGRPEIVPHLVVVGP